MCFYSNVRYWPEYSFKEPTCYKNVNKPTVIDHILTNRARCFQYSSSYEMGLSDFHKLTFTVLKLFYEKQKQGIIKYIDYKNFNSITFRLDLLKELSLSKLHKGDFDKFKFLINNLQTQPSTFYEQECSKGYYGSDRSS